MELKKFKNKELTIKKGGVFYMYISSAPYKCHIVEIVENNMVVFKYYSKHAHKWVYDVKSEPMVNLYHSDYLNIIGL